VAKDQIPTPLANALRSDAERLELRAADLVKLAIESAGNSAGDFFLQTAGGMRETVASLRTAADFVDLLVASTPERGVGRLS